MCVLSQSIFGVGVLLWGTPALLLYGFSYIEVLTVLLPISLAISIFQTITHRDLLKYSDLRKYVFLCLPGLLFGLLAVIFSSKAPILLVTIALFLAGILRFKKFEKIRGKISKNKDFLLPVIGLIHGFSNLGGSLLIVWASLSAATKLEVRTLVSLIYSLLALSQILVISLTIGASHFSLSYVIPAVTIHLISSQFIFDRLNETIFQTLLTWLMFSMGFLLILKYIEIL